MKLFVWIMCNKYPGKANPGTPGIEVPYASHPLLWLLIWAHLRLWWPFRGPCPWSTEDAHGNSTRTRSASLSPRAWASILKRIRCTWQFYFKKETYPPLSWFQSLAIKSSHGFNPSTFHSLCTKWGHSAPCSSSHCCWDWRCTIPAGAANFWGSCVPLKIVWTWNLLEINSRACWDPTTIQRHTQHYNCSYLRLTVLVTYFAKKSRSSRKTCLNSKKRQSRYSRVKPSFLLCSLLAISLHKDRMTSTIKDCASFSGLLSNQDRNCILKLEAATIALAWEEAL